MWFDVEVRYNTTRLRGNFLKLTLWFDVEVRYNTTAILSKVGGLELWFDVEVRYNTTNRAIDIYRTGCGLM